MSARTTALFLALGLFTLGIGAGVARAETWACYDPAHPKRSPVFANAKKKGLRCVLFSASQPWPKAATPPGGAGGATDGEVDGPDGANGGVAEAFGSGRPAPVENFVPSGPGRGGAADEPADREGRETLYGPYIEEAARLYDLPEAFLRAIIRIESNYKYRAVSGVGAQGLMQLMPATGREMGVTDAFDPRQNVLGGARLLRLLANRYGGDMVKVLSSYCSGSGAVQRAGGGLPSEAAEGYVRAVLDYYYQYKTLGEP